MSGSTPRIGKECEWSFVAYRLPGLVVIEAGVTDEPDSPMGYRPGELRSLFEGFQILKYEETTGKYDWGPETIRLVRLVAVKK